MHIPITIVHVAIVTMLGIVFSAPVLAQSIITPERGTQLRSELLDAARPSFVKDTKGPIEFVVRRLTVFGHWSFGHVRAQRPGGGKIDWSKTVYADALSEGVFDPASSFFLLKRKKGTWAVVDYAVGPTDLAWDGWRQEYNLPDKMFAD